jgi:hypothetical protein
MVFCLPPGDALDSSVGLNPGNLHQCPVNNLDILPYLQQYLNLFCGSLFVLLAIVVSVLLRFTDSNYPFGIFKLFLHLSANLKPYMNAQFDS